MKNMAMDHVTLISFLVWLVCITLTRCRLMEVTVGVFVETSDYERLQFLNKSMRHGDADTTGSNLTFTLSPEVTPIKYDAFNAAKIVCDREASMVVSFLPCQSNAPYIHVTSHLNVPAISWSPCTISSQSDWAFAATSIGLHYQQILSEVVKRERWRHLVFIYDEFADVAVVENIEHGLGEVTIVQIGHQNAFEEKRGDFFIQWENYVVYCSRENVHEVLRKARLNRLDILGPRYKWLLLDEGDLDIRNVTLQLQEGDNVAIIRPHETSTEKTISAVSGEIKGVMGALAEEGYDIMRRWNCTNPLPPNISKEFNERLNIQFGSKNDTNPLFSVHTFNHQVDGRMGFTAVGNWSPVDQLQLGSSLYPQLVQGFNNRTFFITTFQYEPFIMLQNGSWTGLLIDFLDELSFALNFSFVIKESDERIFGRLLKNQSFNGLIGNIERKEADFALGPITILQDRAQVVDFTTPYWGDPYIILLRKPGAGESKIFICLGPFSLVVWIVIILSVIVVSVVLWTSLNYYPGPYGQPALPGLELFKLTAWQTFGALMQQGMVQQPVVTSGRVIVAMWWFYVIIIAGVYNGNLIAFLTAPKAALPIESLDDLAKSDMMFGTLKDAAFHGTLASSTGGVYKQLWDKVKYNVNDFFYSDSNDGLSRALNDKKYVYIIEESFYTMLHVKNTSLKDKQCEFVRPKVDFLPNMYGLVFQKNSPYTKLFSMQILRILESGLLERIKNKWLSNGNRCTGLERVSNQRNIGLLEAQGAFYILAIGMVAASLVLMLECFSTSSCSKRGIFNDVAFASCLRVGGPRSGEIPSAESSDRSGNVRKKDSIKFNTLSNGNVPSMSDYINTQSERNALAMAAMETLAYVDIVSGEVTQSNTVYNPHSKLSTKRTNSGNSVVRTSLRQNGAYANSSRNTQMRARNSIQIVRLSISESDHEVAETTNESSTL